MVSDRKHRHAIALSGVRVSLAALCVSGYLLAAAGDAFGDGSRGAVPKQDSTTDFARDIQPILATKCVRCHGPETSEAGLRLDERAKAIGKLDSGNRAIVPGEPDASELLRRVSAEESERMPPEGEPLGERQIGALRQWIAAGANWPAHWAYRSLESPPPPKFADPQLESWVRTPIDRFVLKSLSEHGLRAAPPADRRTLLRRVYFDLIGLPPLPEEADAFLSDNGPDAYERLVDRLLASPRYGERWARHWMDVVHYADSHGFEHDLPRNIWPYRDYLVKAFNDDKPYAEFVREQVAGDALEPGNPDALTATGFLAAGPWDQSTLQSGQMDTADYRLAQYLDRDDIVSTVMTTFVSSTVHCARCHDHKFDPIKQADYYGLQAVFAGIDKAPRQYDADPAVTRARTELVTQRSAIEHRREKKDTTLLAPELQAKVFEWQKRQPPDPARMPPKVTAALTAAPKSEPTNSECRWQRFICSSRSTSNWLLCRRKRRFIAAPTNSKRSVRFTPLKSLAWFMC